MSNCAFSTILRAPLPRSKQTPFCFPAFSNTCLTPAPCSTRFLTLAWTSCSWIAHPLRDTDTDRLTVQRVPKRIYAASYPAWFFGRAPFIARIQQKYELVEELATADRANIPVRYTGSLWRRIGAE